MKKQIFLPTAAFLMIALHALAQKPAKKSAEPYEFPAAMSERVRTEFKKQCDKGAALYAATCAGCHNKKVKGRIVIPDFSPEQIKGYEMRVMNRQHEEALPDDMITPEELGLISTFLTYKKKSGVAVK